MARVWISPQGIVVVASLTGQVGQDLNITDLEVYTMASEEAIDAKLEAIGNRMEEKMRSLFAEFSLEIRGEIKARQSYTLMTEISFARIQEERLNHEVRRTRVTPRPAMPRPTAPSTTIQAPAPKKLTRDELHKRSAKELCWHYDESWSHEHHYKKGRLLVIEPAEDEDNETSVEALELKEEAMEEESQPADYAVHALAGYSNPQMMKVGGLLKQQPITILIDMGSTNNFLNSKVAACLVLQIGSCNKFDVKVADT
ncbi:hypothetical protein BHE74_00031818 [Ensete ventricosum]|nr:hypothetical protein BHE74_00031818 [Ensete ventricosum]